MILRAIQTVNLAMKDGTSRTVRIGEAVDDREPIAKEHPWAFRADSVEQATAAPGERRHVRRS